MATIISGDNLKRIKQLTIRFAPAILVATSLGACGTVEIAVEDPPSVVTAETSNVDDGDAGQAVSESDTPTTVDTEAGIPSETPISNPLPAPLYFINAEDSQIWRVEEDGVTRKQMTSEEAPVTDFDVSSKDGALVYISDNQLIYATSALGGRREVLSPSSEGYDEQDYLSVASRGIHSPRWSPDGAWIIFGEGGISRYQNPAEPRQEGVPEVSPILDNDPLPDPLPAEGTVYEGSQTWYRPLNWLPDGKRVLIEGAYYFALGNFRAILSIEDGSLTELEEPSGRPCCFLAGGEESHQLYYAGNQPGMFQIGLWRLDPVSGENVVLVPGEAGGKYHLFAFPFEAKSGQVMGFYANEPASRGVMPFPLRPMVMVSVAGDGSAELDQLRQDYYVVGEAEWLPDGRGAVIKDVAGRDGGFLTNGWLRYLPSDGSPQVSLPAEGRLAQWGRSMETLDG